MWFKSFSVSNCLTKGFGKLGIGCVGQGCSPASSVSTGTVISLIGYIGLPVALSNKNTKPV